MLRRMWNGSRWLQLVFATGLLSAAAIPCAAQEQFTAETWNRASGAAGLRFGTDDLNLGLGAQLGYTLGMGVYFGADFDYYLGDSEEAGVREVSNSAWTLMVEGGFDFGVADRLVLRPLLGMGIAGASGESCVANVCASRGDTDFELSLGGQALYFIGNLTLGGEIKAILAGIDALVVGLNVGYAL